QPLVQRGNLLVLGAAVVDPALVARLRPVLLGAATDRHVVVPGSQGQPDHHVGERGHVHPGHLFSFLASSTRTASAMRSRITGASPTATWSMSGCGIGGVQIAPKPFCLR